MTRQTKMRRILVLDDEATLLAALVEIVEGLGYQAVTATKGLAAIKAIAMETFDAAVLDINLPDLSGVEVARKWRLRFAEAPVLLASANATAGERAEAEAISGRPVMQKPFGVKEMRLAIASMFEEDE